MKMNRWIVSFSLIVIIFGVVWVMYMKPTLNIDVDLELAGVKYQLGSEGTMEPATVVIQGKLHTNLKGERVFTGVVQVVGEEIPVPQDQRKVEIRFSGDGWGSIAYPYFIYDERGAAKDAKIYHSHSIFANKDFSQVALLLKTPGQQSDPEGGNPQALWNSENGMMLSAPASTREEALALSNKLMVEFLKGKQLE
ncbi:hypothetical protein EMG79_27630 [Klebsiella pneumoniae]|uniref:Uncharacterized protein n=1 Tax=Paenibacillus antri TaxID=2582848 RepID=A0A5R9G1B0_9BACL|nr:hypothetical protein [Paenibacillus antri]TLS50122.1 hypothetical protein FE782_22590 [Paenibacillus antri]TMY74022.1 hypothetical protein EMG79_27630 [Klebsiella pneumoniae]